MFEWLIPLLIVVLLLIWILDLPEIVGEALGAWCSPRSWAR
jgi:hypothetical protein